MFRFYDPACFVNVQVEDIDFPELLYLSRKNHEARIESRRANFLQVIVVSVFSLVLHEP